MTTKMKHLFRKSLSGFTLLIMLGQLFPAASAATYSINTPTNSSWDGDTTWNYMTYEQAYYVENEAYQRISEFDDVYTNNRKDPNLYGCSKANDMLEFQNFNTSTGFQSQKSVSMGGLAPWSVSGTFDDSNAVAEYQKDGSSTYNRAKLDITNSKAQFPLSKLDSDGTWNVFVAPRYKKTAGTNFNGAYILPEQYVKCSVTVSGGTVTTSTSTSVPAPTSVTATKVGSNLEVKVGVKNGETPGALLLGFHDKGVASTTLFDLSYAVGTLSSSLPIQNGVVTVTLPLDQQQGPQHSTADALVGSKVGSSTDAQFTVSSSKDYTIYAAFGTYPRSGGKVDDMSGFATSDYVASTGSSTSTSNSGGTSTTTNSTTSYPAAPENVKLQSTSDGLKATWDSLDGADGYFIRLYHQTASGQELIKTQETFNYVFTFYSPTVELGQTYFVAVQGMKGTAQGDNKSSGWVKYDGSSTSTSNSGGTSTTTNSTTSYPAAPENVKLQSTSDGLKATWDSLDGADGYFIRLYHQTASGQELIKTQETFNYVFTFYSPTVELGQTYFVAVQGMKGTARGDNKSSGWVTYSDGSSGGSTTVNASSTKPTGFTTADNNTKIQWSEVSGASGYSVELKQARCSGDNCSWDKIASTSTDTNAVRVNGALIGQYQILVTPKIKDPSTGKTEDGTSGVYTFNIKGETTMTWTSGSTGGVTLDRGVGFSESSTSYTVGYDITDDTGSIKNVALYLFLSNGNKYKLKDGPSVSGASMKGNIVIPKSIVLSNPELSRLLNTDGVQPIWFSIVYDDPTHIDKQISNVTNDITINPPSLSISSIGSFTTSSTNSGGNSSPSVSAPAQPSTVNAEETDSGLKVSWPQVNGADSYDLLVKVQTPAGDTKSFGPYTTGSKTSWTFSSYTPGTTYSFLVAARNAGGRSDYTSAAYATEAVKSLITAEDVAQNLQLDKTTVTASQNDTGNVDFYDASGNTAGTLEVPKIDVKWSKVSSAEEVDSFLGYSVFWRKEGSNVDWQYASHVSAGTDTQYTIFAVEPETTYEYKVAAEFKVYDPTFTYATTFKDITDVKTVTTGAEAARTYSPDNSEEFNVALQDRIVRDTASLSQLPPKNELKIYPVLVDGNGQKYLGSELWAGVRDQVVVQDAATPKTDKEFFTKIKITPDIAQNMRGVVIGTSSLDAVYNGAPTLYVFRYAQSNNFYGSCEISPNSSIDFAQCRNVGADDSYIQNGVYIPLQELLQAGDVQVEQLNIDLGGNVRSSSGGTYLEYYHRRVGNPVHIEFDVQTYDSGQYPEAQIVTVAGNLNGGFKEYSKGAVISEKNLNIYVKGNQYLKSCEIREINADNANPDWETFACVTTDQGIHAIPYQLKATTGGPVSLELKAKGDAGTRTTVYNLTYDDAKPQIEIQGASSIWRSNAMSNLTVVCTAGDSDCENYSVIETNSLTSSQSCADLPQVAPVEFGLRTTCNADNGDCSDLSFEQLPGSNPTYICAIAQNKAGAYSFSDKVEVKVDKQSPQIALALDGLTLQGGNYVSNTDAVKVKLTKREFGPSGEDTCKISGDITSETDCASGSDAKVVTLTSGDALKKIIVTVTNKAGVSLSKTLYVLRDTTAPVFATDSALKVFDKNTNGDAKVALAPVEDENLAEIRLAFLQNGSAVNLSSDLLVDGPSPDIEINNNELIFKADANGNIASGNFLGLKLQNLPVEKDGQTITYTLKERGVDKANQATADQKEVTFTLKDTVSTDTVTVTAGSVSLPSTSDKVTIPVDVQFSGDAFYTIRYNGIESPKAPFTNFIYLEPGAYTGLTVKFYDTSGNAIADASYGPFDITVTQDGAILNFSGSETERTKNAKADVSIAKIISTSNKVKYTVEKGGAVLATGERSNSDYDKALTISNVSLDENTANEIFVTLEDDSGKKTVFKKTITHDNEAPVVKNPSGTVTSDNKAKWTFGVEDMGGGTVDQVQGRIVNLTTGEKTAYTTLTPTSGAYQLDLSEVRPGHKYVLELVSKDDLGNSRDVTMPTAVTKEKSQRDKIDMLQKGAAIDASKITSDTANVVLERDGVKYEAQLPVGEQIIFGDLLQEGKDTSGATRTKLPVGSYKMTISTTGLDTNQTQTINNFIVEPYYSDTSGDVNGDGKLGISDQVLFTGGQQLGKYPAGDNDIQTLSNSIASKLNEAKTANVDEYLKY